LFVWPLVEAPQVPEHKYYLMSLRGVAVDAFDKSNTHIGRLK
jgi:hypothetical protein